MHLPWQQQLPSIICNNYQWVSNITLAKLGRFQVWTTYLRSFLKLVHSKNWHFKQFHIFPAISAAHQVGGGAVLCCRCVILGNISSSFPAHLNSAKPQKHALPELSHRFFSYTIITVSPLLPAPVTGCWMNGAHSVWTSPGSVFHIRKGRWHLAPGSERDANEYAPVFFPRWDYGEKLGVILENDTMNCSSVSQSLWKGECSLPLGYTKQLRSDTFACVLTLVMTPFSFRCVHQRFVSLLASFVKFLLKFQWKNQYINLFSL